jgi:hypothetical protein
VLSLTECKKILNKKGIEYSDKEVEILRNVLYKLEEVCRVQINQKNKEN